jgi:NitT/TauT family transport system substrate-binding protein
MRRTTAISGLALAATVGLPRRGAAQPAPRTIVLGYEARTAVDWVAYIAERRGFYAANGVKPDVIVADSAAGITQQLTAGNVDLAQISTTQLIEAVEGGAPLTGVLVLDATTPYQLLGKKGIPSVAGLKGKTIVVGGPNDITRVFMDGVMEKNGLRPDDFTYTFIGSTGNRYAALIAGAVDAAILNPPFAFRAAAEGYPLLADVHDYFPKFALSIYAARVEWARAHAELVTAFATSYLQALNWLYTPANKGAAVDILVAVTGTKPEDGDKTYDRLITQLKYFVPGGRTAPEAIASVQAALIKTKELKPPLAPPTKYFDNRYVDAANAALRSRR